MRCPGAGLVSVRHPVLLAAPCSTLEDVKLLGWRLKFEADVQRSLFWLMNFEGWSLEVERLKYWSLRRIKVEVWPLKLEAWGFELSPDDRRLTWRSMLDARSSKVEFDAWSSKVGNWRFKNESRCFKVWKMTFNGLRSKVQGLEFRRLKVREVTLVRFKAWSVTFEARSTKCWSLTLKFGGSKFGSLALDFWRFWSWRLDAWCLKLEVWRLRFALEVWRTAMFGVRCSLLDAWSLTPEAWTLE